MPIEELKKLREEIAPGEWKEYSPSYIGCDPEGDGDYYPIVRDVFGRNKDLILLAPSLLSELISLKEWKEKFREEFQKTHEINTRYGDENHCTCWPFAYDRLNPLLQQD
jgi:hypothetical protein